jgi:hypothetical protein
MIPEPVTPSALDFGRRAQSVYDLEKTLVKFIAKLLDTYRLDNPTLNLAQATRPDQEPLPLPDTDEQVTFDPEQRAQTLMLKVPPRVVRGRVPRTVTGEIAVDQLPDCPSVIVQAVSSKIELHDSHTQAVTTVRILVSAYDENPNSGGYQDVANMCEAIAIALTSFGQQAIDQAYPIVLPLEWKLIEPDCFPHFVGEITTTWQLPAGRPMPDSETFGIVPAEHLDTRVSYDTAQQPALFEPARP